MKKLSISEMVTLSVGLSARIEQLEKLYSNAFSDHQRDVCLQEIKHTKNLLDLIDNTDLYTE